MGWELAHPFGLALVALTPVVLLLHWRRPRPALRWPAAIHLTGLADRRTEHWQMLLWFSALLAGALAVVEPQWVAAGEQVSTEGIALLLIADVSGSMAEVDVEWFGEKISRLAAVKYVFRELIEKRPHDRIGLVLFAAHPDTACPPTLDHAAVLRALDMTTPRGIPTESETNIGDAVVWGLARLQTETGVKSIVLCSDGEHNVPPPALMPRQAGQLAAAAEVKVHAIDAGPSNSPGRVGLQSLAQMTRGQLLAVNADTLGDRITAALNDQVTTQQTDPRRLARQSTTPWLALTAALFAALALAYQIGPGRIAP